MVDVPLPGVGRVSPIHAGNAREMAERKHAVARAVKGERQARAIERARLVGEAVDAAQVAVESRALDGLSAEELAERGLKRMLKVVVLGGDLFAPTSLREAVEAAQGLALVAYRESVRRRGGRVEGEDVDSVERAAKEAIAAVKARIRQVRAG